MGKPRSLEAQMTYIISRNKEGSFATHRDRIVNLKAIATELRKDFKLKKLDNLKLKHVKHLISKWKTEGRSISTIKNRTAQMRWLANHLPTPKINMIPHKNSELGIEDRSHDYNSDKAWTPTAEYKSHLGEGSSLHVDLMREFGLRFKEAATFRPNENVHKDKIDVINGTKGGRDREVPLTNERQRDLISRLKEYVDSNRRECLIPTGMTFKKWEDSVRNEQAQQGMNKDGVGTPHGLRHAYAQQRYQELTGWSSPAAISSDERAYFRAKLSAGDRNVDIEARRQISAELGHGRIDVVSNYIGKWTA
jgi:integrase